MVSVKESILIVVVSSIVILGCYQCYSIKKFTELHTNLKHLEQTESRGYNKIDKELKEMKSKW